MTRLKICIMHNSSPGGAQRLVDEIAVRLAESDEVTICTWGDTRESTPPGVAALWSPSPAVRLRAPFHPFGNLARSYLGSIRAAKTVNKLDFDVALVLACQWGQAPQALRGLQTPHLYFAQEGRRRSLEAGYLPVLPRAGAWEETLWSLGRRCYDAVGSWMDRRAIKAAQAVVTNSHFTAMQLANAYGVSAPVIELGVDCSKFRPGKPRSGRLAAILVGALDPTKGAALAIESLARVPAEYRPPLHLIYNRGDDAYGATLSDLGRSSGVEVVFLRGISDDQLLAEYQSAALLLALALNEPFGLTVLEASASGTPTVAVSEGGFCRTVDPGRNGILVRRDADEIAASVTEIISGLRSFDPKAMATWTNEQWDWDRCVRELRQQLIARARAHPTLQRSRRTRGKRERGV